MKTRNAVALSLVLLATAGFVSNASAHCHGKTREQVRQELIDAQNNGLQFVTNTSYPDVAPMYEQQVAQLKQKNNSGYGAEAKGAAASAKAATTDDGAPADCVGPASFCTPYFGS